MSPSPRQSASPLGRAGRRSAGQRELRILGWLPLLAAAFATGTVVDPQETLAAGFMQPADERTHVQRLSSTPAGPGFRGCNREKIREVLRGAIRDTAEEVIVNCNLTVPAGRVISKRLIVQGSAGSGITIDCKGGSIDGSAVRDPELSQENAHANMILVQSTGTRGAWSTWSRPTDVKIANCQVNGAVRITAKLSQSGVRDSSYMSGHATRMRKITPTRITFDNLTITGRAQAPVYFGVGVTNSTLVNSELKGNSEAVALYLDAESSHNVIKNNYIHTATPREVLAIDASSHNRVMDNRFSALSNGGIFLYRNCGEKATVRHTTPSRNTIVNNVFYYKNYNGEDPSVFLGSRNGERPSDCDKDDGSDFGSGASNLDYAQNNVVMQNQIYKLPFDKMIKEGRSTDSPNAIAYNTTVATPITRLAGCYVPNGYFRDFILHGEAIQDYRGPTGKRYTGRRYTCIDGELRDFALAPSHQ